MLLKATLSAMCCSLVAIPVSQITYAVITWLTHLLDDLGFCSFSSIYGVQTSCCCLSSSIMVLGLQVLLQQQIKVQHGLSGVCVCVVEGHHDRCTVLQVAEELLAAEGSHEGQAFQPEGHRALMKGSTACRRAICQCAQAISDCSALVRQSTKEAQSR